MKIRLSAVLFLILFQIHLNAQDVKGVAKEKSFWGSVEFAYGVALVENGRDDYKYSIKNTNDAGVFDVTRLRLKAGYRITPKFSLGAGTGICTYSGLTKLIPIYADVRYHVTKLPGLYAFADIGASFFDSGNVSKGFLTDLGAGYKIRMGKKFSLNPSIGYNLLICKGWKNIVDLQTKRNETRVRHSVFAGLAFEF
jgi:hypothetical protein